MEALNVSVNEFGYVNLAYMLSIYEPDITNAKEELAEKSGKTADEITFSDDALAQLRRAVLVEELDGLIFLNPDRYNENNPDIGWETADEYLSGNVRDKLRVAKAMAADTDNPQAERFAGNVAAQMCIRDRAMDMYYAEQIVLGAEDMKGVDFTPISEGQLPSSLKENGGRAR